MPDKSTSDWTLLRNLRDEDIDTGDIPPLTAHANPVFHVRPPGPKVPITLRVDGDVLNWYKAQSGPYQSRMHAVLRDHMRDQMRSQPLVAREPASSSYTVENAPARRVRADERSFPKEPATMTLRDDNDQHYHRKMMLGDGVVDVTISWCAKKDAPVHLIGTFRLNLPRLLASEYIRWEKMKENSVRVRIFRNQNWVIGLQWKSGKPFFRLAEVPVAARP